jgi:hypothetical protein
MPNGTRIASYRVEVCAKESKAAATIKVFDQDRKQIGMLDFIRPPYLDGTSSEGDCMIFPMEQFAPVLDMLRNEGPVYFAPNASGVIIAEREPAGEGEGRRPLRAARP